MTQITRYSLRDELQGMSDLELMEWVALKDQDGIAQRAFEKIYDKYKNYIWVVLYGQMKNYTGKDEISDLVQATFAQGWVKAEQFGKNREKSNLKAWLSKIANNLAWDWLSGVKNHVNLENKHWNSIQGTDASTDMQDNEFSEEYKIYEDALETLTDREKDIMTLYYYIHDPMNPHKKAPREILNKLYKKYNISNESLHQIRRRAKLKIEKYVKEKLGKDIQ